MIYYYCLIVHTASTIALPSRLVRRGHGKWEVGRVPILAIFSDGNPALVDTTRALFALLLSRTPNSGTTGTGTGAGNHASASTATVASIDTTLYHFQLPLPLKVPYKTTVSFHNFKSQNFKLSVSNPKSKYVAYVSVLSQISNCQGLGRNNNFEILKTDRHHYCHHYYYLHLYLYLYLFQYQYQYKYQYQYQCQYKYRYHYHYHCHCHCHYHSHYHFLYHYHYH